MCEKDHSHYDSKTLKNLIAIVLTFNEELHIERCLASLKGVADEVLIVDSYSTDHTVEIAHARGAKVVQNAWVNHATQFNWALKHLAANTEWILRIDADEYLTPELRGEIQQRLPGLSLDVDGVYCGRKMKFQGKLIRFGGVFPIRVLRLLRNGRGWCEKRWADEHIKVTGKTVDFPGLLIDDNLNSLTWWTGKHNEYASREAVDLLNLEFGFMPHDSVAKLKGGKHAEVKRWLKEVVYARLPLGYRAFVYFIYRYVVRIGFLDGQEGTAFHLLQGFWYRYLVDAKIAEVKRYMTRNSVGVVEAIGKVLGVNLGDCCRENTQNEDTAVM